MVIAPRLSSPINFGKLTLPRRRYSDPKAPGNTNLVAEINLPAPVSSSTSAPQFHFVMPANATSRTGQTALREYQSIQNEGGPELLNRVDVIV